MSKKKIYIYDKLKNILTKFTINYIKYFNFWHIFITCLIVIIFNIIINIPSTIIISQELIIDSKISIEEPINNTSIFHINIKPKPKKISQANLDYFLSLPKNFDTYFYDYYAYDYNDIYLNNFISQVSLDINSNKTNITTNKDSLNVVTQSNNESQPAISLLAKQEDITIERFNNKKSPVNVINKTTINILTIEESFLTDQDLKYNLKTIKENNSKILVECPEIIQEIHNLNKMESLVNAQIFINLYYHLIFPGSFVYFCNEFDIMWDIVKDNNPEYWKELFTHILHLVKIKEYGIETQEISDKLFILIQKLVNNHYIT